MENFEEGANGLLTEAEILSFTPSVLLHGMDLISLAC